MATTENKTSRRLVLGAFAAIPAAMIAAPAFGQDFAPDATLWNRRLATYRSRRAAQDAYGDGEMAALNRAHRAAIGTAFEEQRLAAVTVGEHVFDRLVDRTCRAFDVLILTPAPHAEALATKLEIFAREEGFDHCDAREAVDAIASDARRIAGAA